MDKSTIKAKTIKLKNSHVKDVNHYEYCKSLEIIDNFFKWLYGADFDSTLSITYIQYKEYLQKKFRINKKILKSEV